MPLQATIECTQPGCVQFVMEAYSTEQVNAKMNASRDDSSEARSGPVFRSELFRQIISRYSWLCRVLCARDPGPRMLFLDTRTLNG